MKLFQKLLMTILFLTVCVYLPSQDSMSIGDNVIEAMDSANPQYKTIGDQLLPLPEGSIDYYKIKTSTDGRDLKFLVIQDEYVIGVLQNVDGKDQILIDATGNGNLDFQSDYLLIPFWIVAHGYEHMQSADDNIKAAFNDAIRNFNSTDNPYTTGAHHDLVNRLLNLAGDAGLPNRDLYYALYSYYTLGDQYPWAALQAMGYLSEQYYCRYEEDHPIFYLHTLESLINLGYQDDARHLADILASDWPEFVPGRVYQWQLEEDTDRKEQFYDELKNTAPEHWIVRQL